MTHVPRKILLFTLSIVLAACGDTASVDHPEQDVVEKTKVVTIDDLPRITYEIDRAASELLMSDDFGEFAGRVRDDVESILASYDIQDAATRISLYNVMTRTSFLEGDYDSALEWMGKSRALEEKEANRLTAGLELEAWIAARRTLDGRKDEEAFRSAFKKELAGRVSALPWEVIQENIEETKGVAEFTSENLIIGGVISDTDPMVLETGTITENAARRLIARRYWIDMFVAVKNEIASTYGEFIAEHRVVKPDIWAERSVVLDENSDALPVLIAIWDTGVDVSIFGDSFWTNPAERFDGTDSDKNGFVDDVHGIAFDVYGHRSPELLMPKLDMADSLEGAMSHVKGLTDLMASVDSDESARLKRHLGDLRPEEVDDFWTEITFAFYYIHGTHVAGIAIEGNPFARQLSARITYDHRTPRRLITPEIATRYAQSFQETVDYFKAAGVRAANMSWGWTLKELEGVLESNGITDPEERKAKAAEAFGIMKKGLHSALESAPEILFVNASGNSDSDVEFDESIPSNFELPNLLVVAAVDQAGDPTHFTSTGDNIVVFANGFEVESYVPGGDRMKASGTSMAAPNVINLAAKLLALNPELTPAEVIGLIKQGATPRNDDQGMLLIHPLNTVELLTRRPKPTG